MDKLKLSNLIFKLINTISLKEKDNTLNLFGTN